MNNLNSVIIEGKTTKEYKINIDNSVEFSIDVSRTYINNEGKSCEEFESFDILCVDSFAKKIQRISKEYFSNRTVRIVGKLKQAKWETKDGEYSKVYILAEHIEIKPL